MTTEGETREAVQRRYADAARSVLLQLAPASCCSGSCCKPAGPDPISGNLYSDAELASVPENAAAASLGCGNPAALATLRAGETVLDLGSGGGIDVLLSAKRVGPQGIAYGFDMTDEMLDLARRNAAEAAATNVEFRKGTIEALPFADASVDVVISNCVINLSSNKDAALREAYRVLKPGGRFAVSDVVVDGPVPADLRRQVELWVGCIAGALERDEYRAKLDAAGFIDVAIEPTRYYALDEMDDPAIAAWLAVQPEEARPKLGRAFFSAFVKATKPRN